MADITKQDVYLPVPASPLIDHSVPNTYLRSAMDLGRSYLQSRDVSYLGHAIRMLRPVGGRVCAKLGLTGFDEMIQTDPQIAQGVDVLWMASTANNLSFGTSEGQGDGALADGALRFTRQMYGQMTGDFNGERSKMTYDLIRYGNGFCELEFKTGQGELDGYLCLDRIHAVDPNDVVIVTDSYNRIIGYAPYGFPGVTSPLESWVPADSFITYLFDTFDNQVAREDYVTEVKLLPKWKVWHTTWQTTTTDPRGNALLDPALHPWWAKQQIMSVLLMLIEEWGRPRKWGKLSERADAVCLYDANGNPVLANDGMPLTRDAMPVLLDTLMGSSGGGNIALPHGYEVGLLQADPKMLEAIVKALDYFNIEISKAVLKQHLASSEGQRGSEKGADSHGDILSLLIQHIKNTVSRTARNQVFQPVIAGNFGSQFKDYTPTVDIGDADGMPINLNEIGFLTQSNYFAPDQFPALDRRIGVPVRDRNTIELPKSATKDAESLNLLLGAKLSQAQEGQSFTLRVGK